VTYPTLSIVNDRGRAFTVTIGDRNHFRPVNFADGLPGNNIVAFYDATHAGDLTRPTFQPHGQFVADYYAEDLLERAGGLDLRGHEPLWKVDASAMLLVRDWVRLMIVRMP